MIFKVLTGDFAAIIFGTASENIIIKNAINKVVTGKSSPLDIKPLIRSRINTVVNVVNKALNKLLPNKLKISTFSKLCFSKKAYLAHITSSFNDSSRCLEIATVAVSKKENKLAKTKAITTKTIVNILE